MANTSRLHDRFFWGLLIVVGVGVTAYAGWSVFQPSSKPDPLSGRAVAEFQFIDQNGRTVALADLHGKVWIAGFIFTRCRMSCPQITSALADLQRRLPHPDLRLVAFTVDPQRDTPDVLRAYATNPAVNADPEHWLFLTDATGDEARLYEFINQSFLESPQTDPDAEVGFEIAHSNRLILIDRKGVIQGTYRCVEEIISEDAAPSGLFQTDEQALARLQRDAESLLKGGWIPLSLLPTVNACLNGVCGMLLCIGYVAIRRRRVRLHVYCMVAAVVVSSLFLASYLYYHFHHGATSFTGQGWIRPVYFTILLTHTVLAAAVVPLVVWTLYRALRSQFKQHARIARWTLPIWLYVSVTGVIVYLFLYHLFPV